MQQIVILGGGAAGLAAALAAAPAAPAGGRGLQERKHAIRRLLGDEKR